MAFKIPLQSEVQAYIEEKKKEWPQRFCVYYAERFWNFYQSNGWKVSGKAAMKDWKAAFNSQWQVLKFTEDITFLNTCLKEQNEQRRAQNPTVNPDETKSTLTYIDEILAFYEKNYEKVEEVRLASCYDWLKENKLMRLTEEEGKRAKDTCNGDTMKGKAICVKIMFDKMITRGLTFKQIYERLNSAGVS
jgi:hypothetical protein